MAEMADPRRIIAAYKYPDGSPGRKGETRWQYDTSPPPSVQSQMDKGSGFLSALGTNLAGRVRQVASGAANTFGGEKGGYFYDRTPEAQAAAFAEKVATDMNHNLTPITFTPDPGGRMPFESAGGGVRRPANAAGETTLVMTPKTDGTFSSGAAPTILPRQLLPAHTPGARVMSPAAPAAAKSEGAVEAVTAPPAATPPQYGGNVGYFSTGGAKPVLTDAGEPGRALTGNRNGVVAGQQANSSDLIGNIISRQPDFAGEAKYRAEVADAAKKNAMLNGGVGYRTAADFGGDGSNSSADNLAARKARSYNLNLDKQMKQSELDSTNSYRQGTLALAGRKQNLEESMAPVEMESKQALSGYYRSRGAADLLKVNKDHAIEVQKLKNEQAQKALEAKNASPMAKANADFFTALGTQAGVAPAEAEVGYKAGFRTPQKAKTHWFTEDQQQGLVDASGKLYTPGAEAQPVRTGTRPNGEVWGQYADGTMKRIK